MNNKGQVGLRGFVLVTVFIVFFLGLMATIEPFKEVLDDARGDSALNCPGTPNFNQSDFDDDDKFDKLNKRTTCFVTGMSMVWFVGVFLIALVMWLARNWTQSKTK